jgi:hypothetical protein
MHPKNPAKTWIDISKCRRQVYFFQANVAT